MTSSLALRGRSAWRAFRAARGGTTAIEYAIIAAGIAVVIVVVVNQIGSEVAIMFTGVLAGLT